MALQHIMFVWAIFALFIVIFAVVALLTHKRTSGSTSEPSKPLLDFSRGQEEGWRMQKVLAEALSGTKTDADFESNFRKGVGVGTGLDAEVSWAWLGRFLIEYRRANEFGPSSRVLAQRFLEDVPRRYSLKGAAPDRDVS